MSEIVVPREQTILEVLTARAERSGDAIALRSLDHATLTYQQLLARARAIAAQLVPAGVGRGSRVAIVMPSGIEMATTFLGVASIATAAPLNPLYRTNEFEFYFDDLRPKALVVADPGHAVAAVARL